MEYLHYDVLVNVNVEVLSLVLVQKQQKVSDELSICVQV